MIVIHVVYYLHELEWRCRSDLNACPCRPSPAGQHAGIHVYLRCTSNLDGPQQINAIGSFMWKD